MVVADATATTAIASGTEVLVRTAISGAQALIAASTRTQEGAPSETSVATRPTMVGGVASTAD